MNLSEQDIYDNLESYRNENGFSQDKMADIIGLSNKQAYLNMVKNKTMKLKYFINLINNTGLNPDYFLDKSMKSSSYSSNDRSLPIDDPKGKHFACPDCIEKGKEIEEQKEVIGELKGELLELHRKYSQVLEENQNRKATDRSG